MRRFLLLLCLVIAAPASWAAEAPGATAAPNADSSPLHTPSVQPDNCPARPPLAIGAPSNIVVGLDPDTLWRPRGAEVRFLISSPGTTLSVAKVRVCFGWASPNDEFRASQRLIGSPSVRSVATTNGAVEYGAIVPGLPKLLDGDWWPRRMFASREYVFTGAFTVPVAEMVVEVTTSTGQIITISTQVGVTQAYVAWSVVALVTALVWLIMDRIAKVRGVRGRNLLLRVISTKDGYASLSQLQIVLWTLVVGMSAIYVMTLSGNLISISNGTLILLGIASGAGLAARVPAPGTPAAQLAATALPAMPEWSDLLIPNRAAKEIDVTRLQMLAFTLITAAFVLIKVVVDYEIPEIPNNFLVLMGISNGVYVGGKHLQSQPKDGGVATE